jgi:acetyl-CoA carboxylase beta subunit
MRKPSTFNQLQVQEALAKEKTLVKKLEAKLSHACPPCELRSKLQAHQRNTLLLQEQLETAQAAANANKEVISRYEREVRTLRSALRVHAAEFQDGSEDTVHSSLIVALAEVCTTIHKVYLSVCRFN